jgi:hypothetical protein
MRSELEGLNRAKQYIGHQLMNLGFRSFDLQSPTKAVVTTRETWKDQLFGYSGDSPGYDEQPISERGPYTLDVTYVLEQKQESWGLVWEVTQVLYSNQPPGW